MQVLTSEFTGFAFCPDSRCPGNAVVEVPAVRQVSEFLYTDNGGDIPGVERTVEHLRFADEGADAACPSCDRVRDLSPSPRPEYPAITGHRQDGLLHVKQFDAGQQRVGGNDAVIAELMKQVAELSALVAGGPTGAVPAAAPPAVDEAEAARQADIRARRLAALAKAREAKAAKTDRRSEGQG